MNKHTNMKNGYFLLSIAVAGLLNSASAESANFEYTLPADGANALLKMEGINSEIDVIATEGNLIRITVDDFEVPPKKVEGMRSLLSEGEDNTGIGFELNVSEADSHTLVLRQVRRNVCDKITLELPSSISLDVATHMNRGFSAKGMKGAIAARTMNGSIEVSEATGPFVINTVNGEVNVDIVSLNQEYPSVITTVNGEVNLSIPASEKAVFDVSVVQGEIFTDLDLKTEKREDGLTKFFGSNKVHATLNGGGVNFVITTVNGEIYLREAK